MKNVPEIIEKLVERFERDIDSLKSATYNETELRADFVNPFWKALGWDMTNEKGYAMQYRDVKQEYPLKTGLTTEAPDYCFTIAGKPKFFLETKKPSVDVKHAIHPAYQLRRYGWSGKLPLSILTDFEEMAVYDCRIRPEKNDNPSQARIKLYTYTDYIDLWDEISGIFSREAILKGSFDKYADSTKGKRGTSEVDSEFLKEIEIWRDKLAKNIALRNSRITVRELNFAVQATIDRIIFLRMAEDRGIEEYSQLQALCSRDNIYKYLLEIFYKADDKYNSGLFHFTAEKDRPEFDNLTPKLKIDDKVLNEILSRLYYPESPYEFSFMPTEILGNVYEQFLGKVIHLTKGHQARVEEKPEVKKAGGVYYTPEYIVEYIVANTVGKLCENKTPKDISDLRILDPACGSGSFLIGAYRFLLDCHLKWYLSEKEQKGKIPMQPETSQSGKKAKRQPAIYQGQDGEWYLSTSEKKRILLNNIYGVDIDSQAVEVTKLSLLLKVLENENKATLLQQIALFKERALPDLSENIKCGNSLIGSDFYERDGQTMLFDEEEQYRINAFDWDIEFPEIFKRKNKGFDAVIGNPPYVRQETLGPIFKEYVSNNYQTYVSTADLYVYFIEKAHYLLKENALFGMICSNKFIRSNYGAPLRTFLEKETALVKLVDFGELPVFQGAATFPIIILTKNKKSSNQNFIYAPVKRLDFISLSEEVKQIGKKLDDLSLKGRMWTLASSNEIRIFEKMLNRGTFLKNYKNALMYYGIKTGLNEAFVIDSVKKDKIISRDPRSAELIKPYILGDDIRKYHINFCNRFLILIPKGWTDQHTRGSKNAWAWFSQEYKAIAEHLSSFSGLAEKRQDKGDYWWELRACSYYNEIEKPKIVYPDIAKESRFAYDTNKYYIANTVFFISSKDLYLLGILNSKLIFHYFKRNSTVLGDADKKGRLRWVRQDVEYIPIRTIDFDNSTDKALHDRMVQLVETMLDLHKRLPNANAPHDKQTLQRQIDATDRQIDKLVYELYGLTEEEKRVVEGRM